MVFAEVVRDVEAVVVVISTVTCLQLLRTSLFLTLAVGQRSAARWGIELQKYL